MARLGKLPIYRMISALVLVSPLAIAGDYERDWDPVPDSRGMYCELFTRTSQHQEYANPGGGSRPVVDELEVGRRVDRETRLWVNRAQCERFFSEDPRDRFFSASNRPHVWYDKQEFFHESQLRPIDGWTTRYIYNKSEGSYVGSELMMPEEEVRIDRLEGYNSYALDRYRDDLYQFSDDGYYFDRKTQLRWRFVYLPSVNPEIDLNSSGSANIILVDESGRYLPGGGLSVLGLHFKISCTRKGDGSVVCGYEPKVSNFFKDGSWDVYWGPVRYMSELFTPLTIDVDKITINRRVSHGEPFLMVGRRSTKITDFFFYADFDDPIRPVSFAPGVLLRDRRNGYKRAPNKQDLIDKEVCLTDCPSDIEWQYSGIRKRIEAHP